MRDGVEPFLLRLMTLRCGIHSAFIFLVESGFLLLAPDIWSLLVLSLSICAVLSPVFANTSCPTVARNCSQWREKHEIAVPAPAAKVRVY